MCTCALHVKEEGADLEGRRTSSKVFLSESLVGLPCPNNGAPTCLDAGQGLLGAKRMRMSVSEVSMNRTVIPRLVSPTFVRLPGSHFVPSFVLLSFAYPPSATIHPVSPPNRPLFSFSFLFYFYLFWCLSSFIPPPPFFLRLFSTSAEKRAAACGPAPLGVETQGQLCSASGNNQARPATAPGPSARHTLRALTAAPGQRACVSLRIA